MPETTGGNEEEWSLWEYGPLGYAGVPDPFESFGFSSPWKGAAQAGTAAAETARGAQKSLIDTAAAAKDIATHGPEAAKKEYEAWKRRQWRNLILGGVAVLAVTGGVTYAVYRWQQ